MAGLTTAR